jgi:hypothetical protein
MTEPRWVYVLGANDNLAHLGNYNNPGRAPCHALLLGVIVDGSRPHPYRPCQPCQRAVFG